MFQLYREGKIVSKPTDDTDEMPTDDTDKKPSGDRPYSDDLLLTHLYE
jgi:hypothetical protein